MTPSESYYSNVMVDQIGDLIEAGDAREWSVIEIEMWHEKYDQLQKRLENLKEAVEFSNSFMKLQRGFLDNGIYDPTALGEAIGRSEEALERDKELGK